MQAFSVGYNLFNTSNILDIHRVVMKETYKMFAIAKKLYITLLPSILNASNHKKCLSLRNQKCKIQPTLINLYPNECNQEMHYHPFAVILDRCTGSCTTLNDLSNKVCIPNKTDLNPSLFKTITGINEYKTLTKHISCKFKSRFDERKCNSDQW